MPWNEAGMQAAASGIQAVATHGQLHSGPAGANYTDNVTSAARVATDWATPTGLGDFNLDTVMDFTGGASQGAVYSITFWNQSSGGVCCGEFPLEGDLQFNSQGDFSVTAIDSDGTIIVEGS